MQVSEPGARPGGVVCSTVVVPSAASRSSIGMRAAAQRTGAGPVGDHEDVYHSIPCWARIPWSIGCLTLVTSLTRSAASISAGDA